MLTISLPFCDVAYTPGGYFKAAVDGPIHLTNLDCEGDEGQLDQCKKVGATAAPSVE